MAASTEEPSGAMWKLDAAQGDADGMEAEAMEEDAELPANERCTLALLCVARTRERRVS